eukprot:scaffold84339_cov33-Phaeocystis_antarctica.AAC.1
MRRRPPCCHTGGPPATMGGPSAQQRPHSGRPQFEGGRPDGGPAATVAARPKLAAARRAARFWGVAARFFVHGRPNL